MNIMLDVSDKKIFVIINSYYYGDIILANPLVQNIKRLYKDAYVIMLTPPNMIDAAKYQEGVDEVIVWDRHGKHHGFFNTLKFAMRFPYNKIYAAFPIYSGDRAIILSFLLKSKYILGQPRNIIGLLLRSKYKIKHNIYYEPPMLNINLLSGITKEKLITCPAKINIPNIDSKIVKQVKNTYLPYISICPTSSKTEKDMPKEDICKIIETSNYNVILLGIGENAKQVSDFIQNKNYKNLIDLTNKTSFVELVKIIELSTGCISVDTGTLHLSNALNKPTVGVFYKKQYWGYKPDPKVYPKSFCDSDLTAGDIMEHLNNLIKNEIIL